MHNHRMPNPARSNTLRTIAIFELTKGLAAILASLGLLSLFHHDLHHLIYALIGHFHLDPESYYPHSVLVAIDWLTVERLRNLMLLAWAYAALRLVEGYGLWKDYVWAEWLAVLSGSIYLPVEFTHLYHRPNAINLLMPLANLAVVAYLAHRLWRKKRRAQATC